MALIKFVTEVKKKDLLLKMYDKNALWFETILSLLSLMPVVLTYHKHKKKLTETLYFSRKATIIFVKY